MKRKKKENFLVPKEALIKVLVPYFEAGILTDIIYISDDFCIFNLLDLRYVLFVCALFAENDDCALGYQVAPQNLVAYIEDHGLAFNVFDKFVEGNYESIMHFNPGNLEPYKKYFDDIRNKVSSLIDPGIIKKIKFSYSTPSCEDVLNRVKNIKDCDNLIARYRFKNKFLHKIGCLSQILLYFMFIVIIALIQSIIG